MKRNNDDITKFIPEGGTPEDTIDHMKQVCGDLGIFQAFEECQEDRALFGFFLAIPYDWRQGVTQAMLADYLGVHPNTLAIWKYREDVAAVQHFTGMCFLKSNDTRQIVEYLKEIATGKTEWNPTPAIKLRLQYVEAWSEKLTLGSEGAVTVVFGGGQSQFVTEEDGNAKSPSGSQRKASTKKKPTKPTKAAGKEGSTHKKAYALKNKKKVTSKGRKSSATAKKKVTK